MSVQGATTDLVTSPGTQGRVPLTDQEILDRHGGVIWEALQAFAMDPGYLTLMAEQARRGDLRRGEESLRQFGPQPMSTEERAARNAEIVAAVERGDRATDVAARYDMHQSMVRKIVNTARDSSAGEGADT